MSVASNERELGAIGESLKNIHSVLEALDEKADQIQNQTTKTNGRVSKLEFWRSAIIYVSGILWGAMLFLSPFITDYIADQITEKVEDSLEERIPGYVSQAIEGLDVINVTE